MPGLKVATQPRIRKDIVPKGHGERCGPHKQYEFMGIVEDSVCILNELDKKGRYKRSFRADLSTCLEWCGNY
jgi:hypothetical protein